MEDAINFLHSTEILVDELVAKGEVWYGLQDLGERVDTVDSVPILDGLSKISAMFKSVDNDGARRNLSEVELWVAGQHSSKEVDISVEEMHVMSRTPEFRRVLA